MGYEGLNRRRSIAVRGRALAAALGLLALLSGAASAPARLP